MSKMLNFLYGFKPFYKLTKISKLEKIHVIDGIFPIADEIFESHESKMETHVDSSCNNRSAKNFIKTLLDPKSGLSKEEIRDEINTFVSAVSKLK